jgi:secreted PhoX family phosphatase
MSTLDRRSFLKTTAAGTGALALAGPLQAFAAGAVGAAPADGNRRGHGRPSRRSYGPLSPVADRTTGVELLALPAGFKYWSLGEVGSVMADGLATPAAHDGMAAFRWGRKVRLVRNHEVRGASPAFGPADKSYDTGSGGGNTIIEFDPRRPGSSKSWGALSGTNTNCAGGATPWGSWLTCEETVEVQGQPHGYVFETPSAANRFVQATPIRSLGRFVHEALAVDPRTNIVYLTEDAGRTSGFYRHVPHRAWRPLAGGRLQMAKVVGTDNADLGVSHPVGTKFPIEWVTIDTPDPDLAGGAPTVFQQGQAKGAAAFSRLEGAWWSREDGAVYFNSTDGGGALSGQVWAWYRKGWREFVELVYESPSSDVLLKPDNLTVSPRGGVLLCEDPDRARQSFLRGISGDGELYDFAANIRPGTIPGSTTPQSWDEFAGATFLGDWLFVNIQTPGVTFAITGPWHRGPLG